MRELLYKALTTPHGIVVRTSNPDLLRQRLYKERKLAGDPALNSLILAESRGDPKTELWIVKNPKETTGAQET